MSQVIESVVLVVVRRLALFNLVAFVAIRFVLPYGGMGLAEISDSIQPFDVNAVITQTNLARSAASLPSLAHSSALDIAAQAKLDDMVANGYFAHVSPTGSQPWDWLSAAGYGYRAAGENLARGFDNPAEVVSAWMNSPSHRANVVSSVYKDIGVAAKRVNLNGITTTVVVQMFGTPSPKPQAQKLPIATSQKKQEEKNQKTQAVSTDSKIPRVSVPISVAPASGVSVAQISRTLSSYLAVWLSCLLALLALAVVFVGVRRNLIRALVANGALLGIVTLIPAVPTIQRLIF